MTMMAVTGQARAAQVRLYHQVDQQMPMTMMTQLEVREAFHRCHPWQQHLVMTMGTTQMEARHQRRQLDQDRNQKQQLQRMAARAASTTAKWSAC